MAESAALHAALAELESLRASLDEASDRLGVARCDAAAAALGAMSLAHAGAEGEVSRPVLVQATEALRVFEQAGERDGVELVVYAFVRVLLANGELDAARGALRRFASWASPRALATLLALMRQDVVGAEPLDASRVANAAARATMDLAVASGAVGVVQELLCWLARRHEALNEPLPALLCWSQARRWSLKTGAAEEAHASRVAFQEALKRVVQDPSHLDAARALLERLEDEQGDLLALELGLGLARAAQERGNAPLALSLVERVRPALARCREPELEAASLSIQAEVHEALGDAELARSIRKRLLLVGMP